MYVAMGLQAIIKRVQYVAKGVQTAGKGKNPSSVLEVNILQRMTFIDS